MSDCVYCRSLVSIELTWPDGREPGKSKTCGHCGDRRRRVVLDLDLDPPALVTGPDAPREATVRLVSASGKVKR